MPKWNKPHGVIVPLDSLLKERRKENCPAPRRSAGLVGRWGITSFTSIRNRNFVSEYNNVDMMEPSPDVGVARDSPEALSNLLSPVAQEPVRPRKFFKSRNILPPPMVVPPADNAFQQHHHLMMGAGDGSTTFPVLPVANAATAAPHPDVISSSTSSAQVAPPHYYQPLSAAATPQFSPTGPQSANVVGGVGCVVLPPQSTDAYAAQHQQQQQQHSFVRHDNLLQASEPTVAAVVSPKSSSRRKKQSPEDVGRRSKGSNKKEKKEKKAKKSKSKEPPTSRAPAAADQPKRNSSRIQNRVINYNEDDDSNDYQLQRQQQKMAVQNCTTGNLNMGPEAFAEPYFPDEEQHPEVSQSIQPSFHCDARAICSPNSDSLTIEGGRTGSRPTTTVPTPLASPSIGEHRPILLRISKGTSMLISTDSEDVSSNSASAPVASDYQPQKQQPSTVTGNSETTTVDQYVPAAAHYHSALARSDVQSPRQQQHHQPLHDEPYQHRYAEEALIGEQQQLEQPPPANSVKEVAVSAVSVPVAVPKTDLKIKISLGGKPMVGATTSATSATTTSSPTAAGASPTVGSTSATGSGAASSGKVNKACRYNFKKRAIEQERARNHLSSKRSRAATTAPTEPKAQGEVAEWFEQTPTAQQQPETAAAPSALFQPSHSATGSSTATAATRPVFPLPGTDTYEVFRTLSSLSGGEDFDSQSSILGSASSDNNTPKHTLPAGEGDHQNHHQQQQPHCQIIHSRGSSDCGSDLELSQNSSTVAAPPSDACSENENTQDINPRPPLATAAAASSPVNPTRTSVVMATTTPLVATGNTESPPPPVVVPPQPATERVEVLKLSLKNVSNRSGPTYSRVTRNKTKTPGTEGAATETIPLDAGNVSPQSLRSSATVTRSVRSRATNNNSNYNNNNNNTVVGSIAVVGSGLETTIKAKKAAKGNANVTAASNGGGAHKKVVQQQEQPQEQRQVSDEFELPLKPPGHGALSGNLGGDGMLKPKTDAQSEVQPTEKSLGSTGNVAASTTTRQYSRRKKNVVPPDYLPEPSSVTLPAEPMHEQQDSGVLDLGMNRGLGCGSDLENKSITTTSAAQLMGDLSTAPLSEQQSMDGNGGGGGADGGTVDEIESNSTMQTVAANSAALQPPAPMRLVLQKKGSIFKSRPLVGSSDGAPEAKKRHVYKHKWDDDDEGNGSGRIRENRSCSTAVVASSDGAEGLDLATSGSSAGIAGNIVSSGCTSGIGGSSGVGAIAGEMLLDPCAPITGEGTVGTGATSAVVSGSVVGCGTAGADAGTGTAESNGDLLECDASLNSLPGGLGPRAKRPNKQASSGGVGLGAGGSGGSCASGVGAAASGTNSNCFGVDAGFGGPNGLPGMNSGGGSGGSSNSGGYHYPAGSAQPYDSESAGFGGDWDDYGGDEQMPPKIRCYRDSKPFYTIVRNVKNSHQMQEIGEFQEMDDDVEYILSALQPDNPVSTRCLSALQLATKCMKPAFKMHVRAHGVVTRFFRALSDAHQDAGLALCTAAIMYVFSQDKLNMDLDRDSLELMLNLLGTTSTGDQMAGTVGKAASDPQQKIRQRVKELCEEIKGSGKAKPHIIGNEGDESSGSSSNSSDGHQISAATLAMESLLSLTSQRAGEWFKDELRKLGGIEHLIKTVSECYESVPERAADWHPEAIAKLRKIERCLRVLNNVCVFNRANQAFLLEHRDGLLVQLLARIYRQLDREIPFHSTDDHTPKEAVGVVVRELHQPILHMLITLTHSFDDQAPGATLVGQQPEMIDITMRILLRIARYVPSRCVFDLHLLALTFLLHLARPSEHNRQQILCYKTAEGKQSGIKELVEYFEQQEEMASHAEAKTNAILETPARTVDTEDTETRLIQKAEHHMEHTYMGSHVCMLIFYLIADQPSLEQIARAHLLNGNFKRMVAAMSRYYEFLNLTTNADAESTAHKRQTKKAIDYLSRLDGGVCEASTSLPNSIILPTPS